METLTPFSVRVDASSTVMVFASNKEEAKALAIKDFDTLEACDGSVEFTVTAIDENPTDTAN